MKERFNALESVSESASEKEDKRWSRIQRFMRLGILSAAMLGSATSTMAQEKANSNTSSNAETFSAEQAPAGTPHVAEKDYPDLDIDTAHKLMEGEGQLEKIYSEASQTRDENLAYVKHWVDEGSPAGDKSVVDHLDKYIKGEELSRKAVVEIVGTIKQVEGEMFQALNNDPDLSHLSIEQLSQLAEIRKWLKEKVITTETLVDQFKVDPAVEKAIETLQGQNPSSVDIRHSS
jgi:hypothetical protein